MVAELPAVYDQEEEQALLAAVLFPRYERMLVVLHHLVQSAFPELDPAQFQVDDAATRRLLALAAERVVQIDATTQQALRALLDAAQRRGYTVDQLVDGVPEDDFGGLVGLYLATWASRPTVIAQTELSEAQLAASLDRYAATGLVSLVRLIEHVDTDAPCARRNGQVVPLASRPGLLHPQCRLRVVPVVDVVDGIDGGPA